MHSLRNILGFRGGLRAVRLYAALTAAAICASHWVHDHVLAQPGEPPAVAEPADAGAPPAPSEPSANEAEADPAEPGSDEPGSDEPGSDEPGSDEPGSDEPGSDEQSPDTASADSEPAEPDPDAPATEESTPNNAEPPATEPYQPRSAPSVPKTACDGKTIRRIVVRGARRVDPDDVIATMKLHRGVPCTDEEVARDARALWNLGFFDDLVIEAEPSRDRIDLVVEVAERPAIGRIVFEGNDEVDDEDIDEKVTLQEGAILSVPKVRRQVTRIRDLYAEEGYFLARVDYDIKRIENDNNEVEVLFRIDEGEEVTVRSIRFLGNRNIPDDELTKVMQTSSTGLFSFLSSDDTFNRDAFNEDVTRLQAYYYDKGYLSMQVNAPRIELTADRNHIDITVPLREGPRFRIRKLGVEELSPTGEPTETLEKKEKLREMIDAEPGDWFSRSEIAVGLQEITRVYRDAGFARAQVLPETRLDERRRVVDVSVNIRRGPLVHIERINVRGNTKTRDQVIRREVRINEGEVYNQSKIEESKRLVTALGYFERVDVSEEDGTDESKMVLNFEVVERPTGTFQVGAGFSSIEQFVLTGQIQQQNLFGRGQSLSLQLQLSGIRQLVQVRFVEPWFLGTQWSLGVDAFNTLRQFQDFTQSSIGGALTFGHPIVDPRLRFSTQYRIERVRIRARTGGLFGGSGRGQGFSIFQRRPLANLFRDGITSSVRLGLTWDSRDNRLFPSNGYYASYSAEIAERALGSDNVFVRHRGFARFYKNIFGPVVFKVNTEIGLITSRLDEGVPNFERFRLGGIFDIRGYPLDSLGPRLGLPSTINPNGTPPGSRSSRGPGFTIGGNLQAFYQVELEFPLVEEVGIKGVLFTDGGNVWNLEDALCNAPGASDRDAAADPCSVNPLRIRQSWGFGFRWFSPLGPLRFEFGIPIRRRSFENKIRFEFNIGNSF